MAAHHEGHQRAAVVQVDPGPVPADGVRAQDLARPLVIEPRPSRHLGRGRSGADAAGDRELGHAVVVARLAGQRPLARIAGLSLQQQGLRGRALERQAEVGRRDRDDVAAVRAGELPVADPHPRVGSVGTREIEHRARCALVVQQSARPGIRERRVGEHELPRREPAGARLCHARPAAEERHLEAVFLPVARFDLPGEVPPLGTKVGVRAVIARKAQHRLRRRHGEGFRRGGGSRGRMADRHRRQREERAPLHAPPGCVTTAITNPALTSPPAPPGPRRRRSRAGRPAPP